MKQILIPRYGGTEVFRVADAPDPTVGADEVRIAVAASGVNFADLSARAGLYPDAPPLPMVVGYEVAGHVDAVGADVTSVAVGDAVMALTRFGGYADRAIATESQLAKLHAGADLIEAAGIPVAYATAYVMLIRVGSLREGDTVLIHSAGGGVGLAALQLARNVGAITIGTASSKKHERLLAMGLDHAIDYRTQDFEKEVLRVTDGRGVDIALDAQGGSSFKKSYRCLAPMGRLFCFGMAAGNANRRRDAWRTLPKALASTPVFHPLGLMNANKGVFGVNMGHLWGERVLMGNLMGDLAGMWSRGEIAPVIDSTYPFEKVATAHEQLATGRNFGKAILIP